MIWISWKPEKFCVSTSWSVVCSQVHNDESRSHPSWWCDLRGFLLHCDNVGSDGMDGDTGVRALLSGAWAPSLPNLVKPKAVVHFWLCLPPRLTFNFCAVSVVVTLLSSRTVAVASSFSLLVDGEGCCKCPCFRHTYLALNTSLHSCTFIWERALSPYQAHKRVNFSALHSCCLWNNISRMFLGAD